MIETVKDKVSISQLIDDLDLEVVYMPEEKEYYVESEDVNRTGLPLAGYFEYFPYERIQIIGKTEYTYFKNIKKDKREIILDKFFSYEIPVLIVTRDLEVDSDIIEKAKKYNRVVLSSKCSTTRFINRLSNYLDNKLAPHVTMHGVLVDVYGIGILITGESGIGKSETALELIKRGHRLVSDDAVDIKEIDGSLIGTSPKITIGMLEVRGIGIIDISSLYGLSSILPSKDINLLMHFEHWKDDGDYDRLGIDKETQDILGVNVRRLRVPVRPGRNIAVIIEAAAGNYRHSLMSDVTPVDIIEQRMCEVSEEE